jgi:hypothetical protein
LTTEHFPLRNRNLDMLVAKMRESKNRSERVSAAQLDLFLGQASRTGQ